MKFSKNIRWACVGTLPQRIISISINFQRYLKILQNQYNYAEVVGRAFLSPPNVGNKFEPSLDWVHVSRGSQQVDRKTRLPSDSPRIFFSCQKITTDFSLVIIPMLNWGESTLVLEKLSGRVR